MYAYLPPASMAGAMQDTIDYIEGRSDGGWWDKRPDGELPAGWVKPEGRTES
jgi:hypothetical protein